MQIRCSCGALLPEDARFCHKCGKPQKEEDLARIQEEEKPVPVAQPTAPPPQATGISFRDMRAVGVTVAAAAIAILCLLALQTMLPAVPLFPVVLLVTGFLVPKAYARNSRQRLTTAAGARLGWMTGLWFFAALFIMFTLVLVVLSSPQGSEMWKTLQANPQFAQMKVPSVHDLATGVLVSALPLFLLVTLLPGLGGMAGARFWKN